MRRDLSKHRKRITLGKTETLTSAWHHRSLTQNLWYPISRLSPGHISSCLWWHWSLVPRVTPSGHHDMSGPIIPCLMSRPGPSLAPGLRCQILIDQSPQERRWHPGVLHNIRIRYSGKKVKFWSDKIHRCVLMTSLAKLELFIIQFYDGRGICEMSFEACLGTIFCKIKA